MSATVALGTAAVIGKATIQVTGVQAVGYVGDVLVWGQIVPDQNPNWQPIDDSQSGTWSAINDSQTPNWTEIAA